VVHAGRTLLPGMPLLAAGVPPCATLELLPRLLGGGGDGGATGAESRSCYLEMYLGKKPESVDPAEARLARWTTCRLSGMPLAMPVVADELGNLMNKEALLTALVSKAVPPALAHITSLRQVLELRLERAPGAKPNSAVQFACPVTGLAFNGSARFVAVRPSGHVVSCRAIKEVRPAAPLLSLLLCTPCDVSLRWRPPERAAAPLPSTQVPQVVEELVGHKWAPEDLQPIAPTGDELERCQLAVEARLEAARAAKREKKNGKHAKAAAAAAAVHAGKRGAQAETESAAPPAAVAKKSRVAELMPAGADAKVWNSLFLDKSGPQEKETYCCRATSARGMNLT
jgi:hypothetical protein